MRCEAVFVAALVIAIRDGILNPALQLDQCFFRLGDQPDRVFSASMAEIPELQQGDRHRGDLCAFLRQSRGHLVELLSRSEGVEQRNMRHPAPVLPVVFPANGLNGFPYLTRGDDNHGRHVGFISHAKPLIFQPLHFLTTDLARQPD